MYTACKASRLSQCVQSAHPVFGHILGFGLALSESSKSPETLFQRRVPFRQIKNVLLIQVDEVAIRDRCDIATAPQVLDRNDVTQIHVPEDPCGVC